MFNPVGESIANFLADPAKKLSDSLDAILAEQRETNDLLRQLLKPAKTQADPRRPRAGAR